MVKTCTRCKVTKLPTDFCKNRGKKDGRHCWCKTCCGEVQANRVQPRVRCETCNISVQERYLRGHLLTPYHRKRNHLMVRVALNVRLTFYPINP